MSVEGQIVVDILMAITEPKLTMLNNQEREMMVSVIFTCAANAVAAASDGRVIDQKLVYSEVGKAYSYLFKKPFTNNTPRQRLIKKISELKAPAVT